MLGDFFWCISQLQFYGVVFGALGTIGARPVQQAFVDPLGPEQLEALYGAYLRSAGVSTDTRSLVAGQVFVALKGPSFDGNQYAEKALAAGASLLVLDDAGVAQGLPTAQVMLVADGLSALQQLAKHHRRHLACPVIGLTGSNGKTTTKELLRAALSSQFNTWATPGNLNNHIGLPLTLLKANETHQLIVLEMGDNHAGEIHELCVIAEPTHGLITNIGLDHIAGYASQAENIATKLELFDWVGQHDGEAYVNLADPAISAYARRHALVTTSFGTASGDLWADHIEASLAGLSLRLHWRQWDQPLSLQLPLYGRYNVENVLAAAAVALSFGISAEGLREGFASYVPSNNRSQVVKRGELTIVMDAYNANPSSMQAAIEDFVSLSLPGSAVLLGDMLELGDEAADEHRKVGEQLRDARNGLRILLVGPLMQSAAEALPSDADVHYFASADAARQAVPELLNGRSALLVKGSRGMALERLV